MSDQTRLSGPVFVRGPHQLTADPKRVITRLFLPGDEANIAEIVGRVMALPEERSAKILARIQRDFGSRHRDVERILLDHYKAAVACLGQRVYASASQELLIGAYFTAEYSLESVALFNPSIVPHPNQRGLSKGELRFIMSLRACGEGHVSSIEFRSGIIGSDNKIRLDPVTPFAEAAKPMEDALYERHPFFLKVVEMGAYNDLAGRILDSVGAHFTMADLHDAVEAHRPRHIASEAFTCTAENLLWLARSNYHIEFSSNSDISERVVFPVTENECQGIEDARFARFVREDGEIVYYATYTAYNGYTVLPQFIETEDFLHFKIVTLNGRCVQNKGLAIFPRKVDGSYRMLSRLDGRNLFVMTSDNLHFWNEAKILEWNTQPWEFVQVGNCGSPIETKEGWLVLTHGVGPMRQYCLGAILLDLNDPSRVIAHSGEPVLIPEESERDGYVPNVVYSCGALVHDDQLVLPYAMSDTATGIASVSLSALLSHMVA